MGETRTLTPADLIERITLVDVDDLAFWEDNPNQGDLGAIDRSFETFGQLDVILIRDGGVVSGEHRVRREMESRQFDGKLAALDISDLEWDDHTAIAAALAMNRTARLGYDDPGAMLDALAILKEHNDGELLSAASWDDDDMRALQIQLHAEMNLENVSERLHTEASDEHYVVIRPDEETMALWLQFTNTSESDDVAVIFRELLEAAGVGGEILDEDAR